MFARGSFSLEGAAVERLNQLPAIYQLKIYQGNWVDVMVFGTDCGYGYGYGYGDGSDSGYGYGDGSGYGNGYGFGPGRSNGEDNGFIKTV